MKKFQSIIIVLLAVIVSGCSNSNIEQQEDGSIVIEQQTEITNQNVHSTGMPKENEISVVIDNIVDYSEYFQGISGCVVIYDEAANAYSFYNKEKCATEVSPLSTFKIISALAGLENNVLENEDSTMEYSGMQYSIDTWNADLTLKEAFETSCIWYFRQVVDMVGEENISTILEEIQYGNCDISEWNGSGINPLSELNGFWLDSSLKISPKQQVDTLNYIFSMENNFSAENLEKLKNLMYVTELDNVFLYGKTGSGTDGKAWFVGFIEKSGNKTYFAVYLDDGQNKEMVSGNKAKEIAISIILSIN
ncbi:MAG: penicillin-binding transpeptidase domain-containing protein [Clostridiales bacterium]|nr:penicillin-binding transpeptidase domain-containing protein [Clostridiales bacterium]